MLKGKKNMVAKGEKVGITRKRTHTEFCLMSRRLDSGHNLNPNDITNLLWKQVSWNTLMVYTPRQNNFPLEGFSGDNISNTVWLWVTPAFHGGTWACRSQVRLANSKQVETEDCHGFHTADLVPQQVTCLFSQFLPSHAHTSMRYVSCKKCKPALDNHGFKLWAPISQKLGQLWPDQNSLKKI